MGITDGVLGDFVSLKTINASLAQMVKVAEQKMDLKKGVAFVLVKKYLANTGTINFEIVNNTLSREPSGLEDNGTNYFGIAMSKLAFMLRTNLYSGAIKTGLRNGEVKYEGGILRFVDEFVIYTGFSGATEKQDLRIAEAGMKVITKAL